MLKKRIILFLLILSILLISGCSKQKTNVENISASSLSNGIRESINKANIFDVYMERISWINHHYDDKDYVTTLNVGDGKSMYPIFYPGNQLKVMAYFGGNLSKGEIACFYFEPYERSYNQT